MHTIGALLIAAAGSVALVGFTPPGAIDAGPPRVATTTQGGETLPEELTPVDELPAQEAMTAIRDALRPYDSVYGGMHWNSTKHQIEIYLKEGAESAATRGRAISAIESVSGDSRPGIARVVTLVPLSFEEQAVRLEEVVKNRQEWGGATARDHVFEADLDPLTAVVTLVADASVEDIRDEATAAFGSQVRVIQHDRPEPQSR